MNEMSSVRTILRLEFITHGMRYPLITSVAYLLGAELAFLTGTLSDNIFAPFWPPNVILFCALLGARHADWWKFLLAVLPAHIVAELQVGMPWPQLTVAFLTNCVVALLNAGAVRWLLVDPPWLSSFRRGLVFVTVAAGIGPAIVALVGAYVRIYGGGDSVDYWKFFGQWYLANALGNLSIAPVLLAFFNTSINPIASAWSRLRWTESALVLAGVISSCIVAIKVSIIWAGIGFLPAFLCLPIPFVFWATVRFGIVGAGPTVLALTVTSIWVNLSGPTVFDGSTEEENILAFQLFLIAIAVPVLLLGSYVDGANRIQRRSRALSQMVLSSKEKHQRKISADLHDGVCQDLAAAYLTAHRLFTLLPLDTRTEAAAAERLILDAIGTLRTTAYGMYPPLLAEGGLEPALRSFLRTFTERTGIVVSIDLAADIGRLSPDTENVAFRIVEEALVNVERHSASTTAKVTLARSNSPGGGLVLSIADPAPDEASGTNVSSWLRSLVPPSVTGGLGIAAMTERVHAIGGHLNISLIAGSTVVDAVFPDPPTPLVGDVVATVR
jgi:signal transduction histidine kinase